MKKFILSFIITSMMFGGYFTDNFLRYSTAYGSFSFNTPRYQDDRFSIIGGLSTGQLEIERENGRFTGNDIRIGCSYRHVISYDVGMLLSHQIYNWSTHYNDEYQI